jgi:rod shape-determining protein MreC
VYSRYPFAFKDELSVDAGSDQGVGVGAAAVFDGVLVGKVSKTYSSTSLIQTLFDPRMKVAVRVGKGAVDALLQGGLEPRLTLISKNAKIAKGDVVYSADYSAPYGISIGTVGDVALSPDNLFQEASVSFPYDLNTVRTLDIIMDWNHALQTTR